MRNWYGCIGFVSLLGVWGLIESEPLFLPFFAFVLFFEYFWVTPDEMFVDTMKKSASWAFLANLFITTAVTLALSYFEMSSNPLAAGTAVGFGVSIAVFACSASVLERRERIYAKND